METFESSAANEDRKAALHLAEALTSTELLAQGLPEVIADTVSARIDRAQVQAQHSLHAATRLSGWIDESAPDAERPRLTPGQVQSELVTAHERLLEQYAMAAELWLYVQDALERHGILDPEGADRDPMMAAELAGSGQQLAAAYRSLEEAGEYIGQSWAAIDAINRVATFGLGGPPPGGVPDLNR